MLLAAAAVVRPNQHKCWPYHCHPKNEIQIKQGEDSVWGYVSRLLPARIFLVWRRRLLFFPPSLSPQSDFSEESLSPPLYPSASVNLVRQTVRKMKVKVKVKVKPFRGDQMKKCECTAGSEWRQCESPNETKRPGKWCCLLLTHNCDDESGEDAEKVWVHTILLAGQFSLPLLFHFTTVN